jgi:hypothetical protein
MCEIGWGYKGVVNYWEFGELSAIIGLVKAMFFRSMSWCSAVLKINLTKSDAITTRAIGSQPGYRTSSGCPFSSYPHGRH